MDEINWAAVEAERKRMEEQDKLWNPYGKLDYKPVDPEDPNFLCALVPLPDPVIPSHLYGQPIGRVYDLKGIRVRLHGTAKPAILDAWVPMTGEVYCWEIVGSKKRTIAYQRWRDISTAEERRFRCDNWTSDNGPSYDDKRYVRINLATGLTRRVDFGGLPINSNLSEVAIQAIVSLLERQVDGAKIIQSLKLLSNNQDVQEIWSTYKLTQVHLGGWKITHFCDEIRVADFIDDIDELGKTPQLGTGEFPKEE